MSVKKEWSLNRREFIKNISVIGIASQLGFIQACADNIELLEDVNSFFSVEEMKTLKMLMETLFPNNGTGPSITEINAIEHIIWSLNDHLYGYNPYEILKQGLVKFDTLSEKSYATNFSNLNNQNQSLVVSQAVKVKWGEKMVSRLLMYIFEALSMDPLYKVNTNEKGWNWLNHQPGFPRPQTDQLYPTFITKQNEKI
ncbi:MAG: gluconate 2-dehydrogenase subunit 3 family protein [Crocinitomicaceae bacterium]